MNTTERALDDRQAKGSTAEQDRDDDLAVIREQTRDILALMRQLIELLLPKGDPDGPKLEDLIAALVAQQARTLMVCQQISTDVQVLLERQGLGPDGQADDHLGVNGAFRS